MASNWIAVTESKFPWERDALEFVRERFPTHEPYRAWANFEFIADDGSINEVDLLVFTPQGFYLVEIKSRPGRLYGDAGTWTWENEGKLTTTDNPLFYANLKAKKLRTLLQRQKACRGQLPFLETLVFCSAPELRCELQGNARFHICLRDREPSANAAGQSGILAAIKRRECNGLSPEPKGTHDRPMAKAIGQALEQAGIRPSQRHRKVSDYVLEELIGEGPGYQDWQATHVQLKASKRRVRLYLVRAGATHEDRQTTERAALREFQILETLEHPGILRAHGFTEHELGPAIIFEHDPQSVRLDHYLAQRGDKLNVTVQLDLVRQIAEILRYAHEKKVVHRALSPQSILIVGADSERPRAKVFNWQVGYRSSSTSSAASRSITPTAHVERLVEDTAATYMAPEAFYAQDNTGEHLDVFSLGAIAYHVFSGNAPASNPVELGDKLRETKGLQISSVLNGATEGLQFLIQYSTHPDVANRIDSVTDFIDQLNTVENELTTPENEYQDDPGHAQMGDVLPGDLHVIRRLGQGASSVALLVARGDQSFVVKVANDPDHNQRIKDEAQVLKKLRHTHIVDLRELIDISGRTAFLMHPIFADKDKKVIETLGYRLRKEGRLHAELLQRFGEDLLDVVRHLEEQGIPHRDIKPDNIAVGLVGGSDKLHLVLFDFSLSRTPPENIRAGTPGYLDPLLPLRKPVRWDLHAERYAASVTLYELATGTLPKWGDGATDPSHLDCEITIDAELFEPNLREPLRDFFRKALRRDPAARFDNAEEMVRAWRQCFEGVDQPGNFSDHEDETHLRELLAHATWETQIAELGLGTRATNALDSANILTVEELLSTPSRRLVKLRGVGYKTTKEIFTAIRLLRERLGNPGQDKATLQQEPDPLESTDPENSGIDLMATRILRASTRERENTRHVLRAMLGLDAAFPQFWPSQSDVARFADVTRARIGQIVSKFVTKWAKDPAITKLRSEIDELLSTHGGVMPVTELAKLILIARGSTQDEPIRTQLALAVVRTAIEVERGAMAEPRVVVRRDRGSVLLAQNLELADYAVHLGQVADQLADEDPLVSPARVIERLRKVSSPIGSVIPDTRLVRLAAGVSQHAAVSSRQELYPRGMSAARALKLSQGALLGPRGLTVADIRDRVTSRYPEAEPLPDRPALDSLLQEAGIDLPWNSATGKYVSPRESLLSSGSESVHRLSTGPNSSLPTGEITPDIADARQFEERLQRAIKDGAFLALMVNGKCYEQASTELSRRFPVQLMDLEGLFVDALRDEANKAKVKWDLVLKSDATPKRGDWDKFMLLVDRAIPILEQQLLSAEKTILLIYSGLLARYDRMNLLDRLRSRVGRRDGIPGLWLLVVGDQHAMLDDKPVPIISPGQRASIPMSWIENRHRSHVGEGAPA